MGQRRVFSTVYSQMNTMFVLQGKKMEPHMGSLKFPLPPSRSYNQCHLVGSVYDRIIVPLARNFTGNKRGFTQLTRIGVGLVISIFAMLVAGIVEVIRLHIVARDDLY